MSTIKLKMKKLDYETNESYKTLRTNLQFCGEDKKVIVMTSCTPNEEKVRWRLTLHQPWPRQGRGYCL